MIPVDIFTDQERAEFTVVNLFAWTFLNRGKRGIGNVSWFQLSDDQREDARKRTLKFVQDEIFGKQISSWDDFLLKKSRIVADQGKNIEKWRMEEAAMRGFDMTVNINDRCRVKLTPYGLSILQKPENAWRMKLSDWDVKTGCYTAELWGIMRVFGECLWMGNPKIPFEGNQIEMLENVQKDDDWVDPDTFK